MVSSVYQENPYFQLQSHHTQRCGAGECVILHTALRYCSETKQNLACLVCSLKRGGKKILAVCSRSVPGGFLRSRLAQQLCRTFQKVSLSRSFFLFIARSVTFSPFHILSLLFSPVFCCVLCLHFLSHFSVFPLNFTHLS